MDKVKKAKGFILLGVLLGVCYWIGQKKREVKDEH